jgi:hypothetical protein
MKTRVYITVDTEAAEERTVGGRELPAQGYDVRVWGRFVNQRRELGIGLIMNELEAEGLRGTFYTEVLGSHYFGRDRLREIVRAMLARGHDVQLHTHPVQRVADWRTRGVAPEPDDIAAYDVERQADLLREGVAILEDCGAPKGSVLSFRAGNFGANDATWEAMAKAGLVLSSNYNPCYFGKNCKMRAPGAGPALFLAGPEVWELPIANFREGDGGFRHVQVTAVSLDEIKGYLLDAHRRNIGEACLVTHSFEMCHIDDPAARRGRVNSVNLARLRGLCRFLSRRADLFEVDTAGALAARLRQGTERVGGARGAKAGAAGAAGASGEYPRGRAWAKGRRLIEQAVKRAEAKAPFSFGIVAT